MGTCINQHTNERPIKCQLQVEQQQQVVMRKQEQAVAAREALQQLKAAPDPRQHIAHLILQQNQPLYLARVLQVHILFHSVSHDRLMTPLAAQIQSGLVHLARLIDVIWTHASSVQQD